MKHARVPANSHDELRLQSPFTTWKRIFARLQHGFRRSESGVLEPIELKVHVAKDDESGRWYIAESDIPGLRVEADSADELIRKVEDVAPDLIELNAAEVCARHGRRSDKVPAPAPKRKETKRPVSIRPVFDSAMAVC
jgi:hypothetical protein